MRRHLLLGFSAGLAVAGLVAMRPVERLTQGDQCAARLATFDTLDFEIFSNQKWDRFPESHAANIIVTWPDGHDTRGLPVHIRDLEAMFVYAPDTKIKEHPIRLCSGDYTAVMGYMTGTFSRPMPLGDGKSLPPTGKSFRLPMATIGHWTGNTMDHEWLFWDNQTFMRQIGAGQ
ncbi:MAG: ester cyclase [Gammaproteobacteria bacterium]